MDVRWAIVGDMSVVFPTVDMSAAQADCLSRRSDVVCVVAEEDEQVTGFMAYELVADCFRILYIWASPAACREATVGALLTWMDNRLCAGWRKVVRATVALDDYQTWCLFRYADYVADVPEFDTFPPDIIRDLLMDMSTLGHNVAEIKMVKKIA